MSTSAHPELVRFADCTDQPWANGGGSTRVIAVGGDSPGGTFDWRLSIASVTSGAFSRFPRIDRVIVLAEGPPMTLTIDGEEHLLEPFRPKRFAGEAVVTCETPQPSFDFNVMTRRQVCTAEVSIRVGSGHVSTSPGTLTVIVVLAGSATVRSADGHVAELGRFDSVRLSSAADFSVEPQGRVALVRVTSAAR
ncbi:HutD family protein [Mycobacterium sp. 21AC1]|uniref:HutD/Ves family protein n=1 Tax=[Mycobacterium] appelbergii TaxID=2939269 RepID=UPI002938F31C|nr:HutD family protein [Mycobacterium sp. 21AC1]MDV3127290.1 HutD family protein [Mycobacterium sp. 21AC1]